MSMQEGRLETAAEIVEVIERKDWAEIIEEQLHQLVNADTSGDELTATRRLTNHRQDLKDEINRLGVEKELLLLALYLVKDAPQDNSGLKDEVVGDLDHIQAETARLHEYFREIYGETGAGWIESVVEELERIREMRAGDIDPEEQLKEWRAYKSDGQEGMDWFIRNGPSENFMK
jgi:hypothetical protein